MPDVISIGEVMVQMNPVSGGPLRHARLYERHVAGSEANTLAGLQRLGVSTGFISRVGKDELGLAVLAELRAEGIDVSRVSVDPEAPTGVYFVQRGYPVQGKTLVFYYRANSAASRTGPEDVPEEALDGARMVHLSGITPVLSESCRQACLRLVELARKRNVPVVFDTNIRVTLWRERARALEGLKPFLAEASYVFTGDGDLSFLFDGDSLESRVAQLRALAPAAQMVIVKRGAEGATVFMPDGSTVEHGGFRVKVVDELGAGDAFDAAFLASLLQGRPVHEALRLANAAGALTVTALGDLEPLPTWDDLRMFLARHEGADSALLR